MKSLAATGEFQIKAMLPRLWAGRKDKNVVALVDIDLNIAAMTLPVDKPTRLLLALGNVRRHLFPPPIEPGEEHSRVSMPPCGGLRKGLRRFEVELQPGDIHADSSHIFTSFGTQPAYNKGKNEASPKLYPASRFLRLWRRGAESLGLHLQSGIELTGQVLERNQAGKLDNRVVVKIPA